MDVFDSEYKKRRVIILEANLKLTSVVHVEIIWSYGPHATVSCRVAVYYSWSGSIFTSASFQWRKWATPPHREKDTSRESTNNTAKWRMHDADLYANESNPLAGTASLIEKNEKGEENGSLWNLPVLNKYHQLLCHSF